MARAVTAVVKAVFRLAAVAVEVAPIAKLLAGVGVADDAVRTISSLVPSGSLKVNFTELPSWGLVAPRSTDIASGDGGTAAGGVGVGWMTVAPAMGVEIALSLSPNGDAGTGGIAAGFAAKSSPTCTEVGVRPGEMITRPNPLVPTSAD